MVRVGYSSLAPSWWSPLRWAVPPLNCSRQAEHHDEFAGSTFTERGWSGHGDGTRAAVDPPGDRHSDQSIRGGLAEMDCKTGFTSATLFGSSLPLCRFGDAVTPAIRGGRQSTRLQHGLNIVSRGPRRSSVSRRVPSARPDHRRDTSWRVVLAAATIAHGCAVSTRAARIALEWSIETVAEISGVDVMTIKRIEAGDLRVDTFDVLAVACVLGIEPLTRGPRAEGRSH